VSSLSFLDNDGLSHFLLKDNNLNQNVVVINYKMISLLFKCQITKDDLEMVEQ